MVSSINSKSVYLELQFEENSIRLETLIEKILCPGLKFLDGFTKWNNDFYIQCVQVLARNAFVHL